MKKLQHDTTIFNVNSSEFFINMKKGDIPPVNHKDREAFMLNEFKKCDKGININGIFIPPTLYYDLNFHKIELDEEGRSIGNPVLRDNGWIIHNDIWKASQQKVNYSLGGARQIGKSDIMVSLTMRDINIYSSPETIREALIVFGSSTDKSTFSKKAKVAIDNAEPFIQTNILDNDWKKDEIRFGEKSKSNEDTIYARLYLYNADGGKNTQIGAGKSLTYLALDEICKYNFKKTYNTLIPAFRNQVTDEFRNVAFTAFTGGEVELSKDGQDFFLNPEANEILVCEHEGKKVGRFLGGWYRGGFKEEKKFVDYIKETEGKEILEGSFLDKLTIRVTNFEKANEKLDKKEKLLLETGKISDYNDERIFYPRDINSMFLKTVDNPFSSFRLEFEKLLKHLESIEIKRVDFDEQGKTYNSAKLPLLDYPYNKNTGYLLDTPLCVVDEPRLLSSTKLYVGGADVFNVVKTSESSSLGSFYIMRRETSDYTDAYNNRIVAWYNGRKDISHFRKILTNTLLYYGVEQGCVTMLHEAADDTFTQYFTERNKGYYLEDTYTLSREINPETNTHHSKGLRAIKRNQEYYLSAIVDYLEEELPDGRLGLWRIPDSYLIKQLMNFDGDLAPFDAIVAFGHTITHLKKESKYRPNVSERVEVKEKPKVINNAFGNSFKTYKKSAI